jgi:branched-subunit amino acid aminotransferase/4-amino-4-deoxychorismate lyase
MTRTVYVNGAYLPEHDAKVSIFDRGFLMADGVYEVTSVLEGKLIDFDGHAVRLERSLRELDMRNPISKGDLLEVHRELLQRNDICRSRAVRRMTAISCFPTRMRSRRRLFSLPRTNRGSRILRRPR